VKLVIDLKAQAKIGSYQAVGQALIKDSDAANDYS